MAKFTLPSLPYALNALEPHISQKTLEFHYGKHHQTYVDNLNKLVEGTEYEDKSLEEIIKTSDGGIFNNAAQVWNHTFYWNCLSDKPQNSPQGQLKEALIRDFGSVDNFVQEFTKQATALFGSGWLWLAKSTEGKLEIIPMSNAGNPLTLGKTPIMVIDVWEHAYYLDKQNERAKYIESYWIIVNWQFIEKQFQA